MQKVANQNDNYKYILVGVDVLSRRIFAAPTKSKASGHMKAAFNRLFKQMDRIPRRIFSDKGLEFRAADVQKHLEDYGVDRHVAQSPDVKAAVAERFIRTLKGRLYKYFTNEKTMRWVDVLPKIVASINNTKSRATGMRPVDINEKNATMVWNKVYGEYQDQQKPSYSKAKFRHGDKVRISKEKTAFEKSYLPNYTHEVYEVEGVKQTNPHVYDLTTSEGEPIAGRFYDQELVRTQRGERKLVIEKVLGTRKKGKRTEYHVKWKGRPMNEAAWITSKDLIK